MSRGARCRLARKVRQSAAGRPVEVTEDEARQVVELARLAVAGRPDTVVELAELRQTAQWLRDMLVGAEQLAARLSGGLADAGLTGDALRASEAAVALPVPEPLSRQVDG